MAQTAHLGGKIRHSEIRNGAVISTENEAGENAGNEQKKEKEDKDDD
jgi:hypothetical protein